MLAAAGRGNGCAREQTARSRKQQIAGGVSGVCQACTDFRDA